MPRCSPRQSNQAAKEAYKQMEATASDYGRVAEAREQVPKDGQPAGDEGQ